MRADDPVCCSLLCHLLCCYGCSPPSALANQSALPIDALLLVSRHGNVATDSKIKNSSIGRDLAGGDRLNQCACLVKA